MADAHPLALLLRTLNGYFPLSDGEEQTVLRLPYMLRTYRTADYLVREGEGIAACVVLVSGFAFRQKTTKCGARQLLSIHIPGEAIDVQQAFLDRADHSIQAMTALHAALVPRTAIRDLALSHPGIGRACAIGSQVDASITQEWILNVGRRNARGRLAHLICELALRLHPRDVPDVSTIELPMSQELLADATGLTPVHVNRTLKTMEAEGLIARSHRTVCIPCWQRLREVAGFDGGYLHLGEAPPAPVRAAA